MNISHHNVTPLLAYRYRALPECVLYPHLNWHFLFISFQTSRGASKDDGQAEFGLQGDVSLSHSFRAGEVHPGAGEIPRGEGREGEKKSTVGKMYCNESLYTSEIGRFLPFLIPFALLIDTLKVPSMQLVLKGGISTPAFRLPPRFAILFLHPF